MYSPGRFERLMNQCPVVDCDNLDMYPLAPDREIIWMEKRAVCGICGTHVFPFVRVTEGHDPYVEIYIWDPELFERDYVRFVICEGMCLSEDRERDLDSYARSRSLKVLPKLISDFCSDVMRYFPEWCFREYEACDIGQVIDHVYYASHSSGPKEVFYKAGLHNIAYHLHEYESYNLIGTTPCEILGVDMPAGLLRILNQPMFTVYFLKKEDIERSTKVYACFSKRIGSRISLGQWVYLESLYIQGRSAGFNKKVYDNLSFLNKSLPKCWEIVDMLFGMLDVFDYYGFELP